MKRLFLFLILGFFFCTNNAHADFCPVDIVLLKYKTQYLALNGKKSIRKTSMVCGISENRDRSLILTRPKAPCGFITGIERIEELRSTIRKSPKHGPSKRLKKLINEKTNLNLRIQAGRLLCQKHTFTQVSPPTPTPTATPTATVTPEPVHADPESLTPYRDNITADEARHLFNKIGFGASKAEISRAVRLGLHATVDELVEACRPTNDRFLSVDGLAEANRIARQPSECETTRGECDARKKVSSLESERAYLMTHFRYNSPVCAAMAEILFNRFSVDQSDNFQKAKFRERAENYRKLIMQHLVGKFSHLVSKMHTDASMVAWLTNDENTWSTPNENYGREVLELFTVGVIDPYSGENNYTEGNMRAMSRAMSGFLFENRTVTFKEDRWMNKAAPAAIRLFAGKGFAKTGFFTANSLTAGANDFGNDTVTPYLLNNHPSARRNLAATLLGYFISPDVSRELIEQTGNIILESQYDLSVVLKIILKSESNFAEVHTGTTFKSPVEHMFSIIRSTNLPLLNDSSPASLAVADAVGAALADQGQGLLTPPTVFGWNISGTWRMGQLENGSDFATIGGLQARENAVNVLVNSLRKLPNFTWSNLLNEVRDAHIPLVIVTDLAKALGFTMTNEQRGVLANYLTRMAFDGDDAIYDIAWDTSDNDLLEIKLSGLIKLLADNEGASVK